MWRLIPLFTVPRDVSSLTFNVEEKLLILSHINDDNPGWFLLVIYKNVNLIINDISMAVN